MTQQQTSRQFACGNEELHRLRQELLRRIVENEARRQQRNPDRVGISTDSRQSD